MSSSEVISLDESLRRRMLISVSSVRASSAGVSMRRIYASAFGVDLIDGMVARRHSRGIWESWSARFLAASSWYVGVVVVVIVLYNRIKSGNSENASLAVSSMNWR